MDVSADAPKYPAWQVPVADRLPSGRRRLEAGGPGAVAREGCYRVADGSGGNPVAWPSVENGTKGVKGKALIPNSYPLPLPLTLTPYPLPLAPYPLPLYS